MPQIDHTLAQHDPARRTVGEIETLCGNLHGEAKSMGSMGAGDLRLRTSLPRERPGNIVWRGRQWPELRMNFSVWRRNATIIASSSRVSTVDLASFGTVGRSATEVRLRHFAMVFWVMP
ncbi:hypothetical protein ABIB57_002092 [Devosia sp. UYZn731]